MCELSTHSQEPWNARFILNGGGEGDRAQYLITEAESCEHTSHQRLDRLHEMITYHLLTSK